MVDPEMLGFGERRSFKRFALDMVRGQLKVKDSGRAEGYHDSTEDRPSMQLSEGQCTSAQLANSASYWTVASLGASSTNHFSRMCWPSSQPLCTEIPVPIP